MSDKKWNPAQKSAIEAKGGSVLVSAAAGSGKTAVLIARIIEKITDKNDPTNVDELVVVTFSNAAASEMKSRLNARLTGLIADNPEDDFYQRQKMLVPKARISTVHALCSDIIRNNFNLLDICVDFHMGDENMLNQLREKIVSDILSDEYEKGDEAFLRLNEMLYTKNDKQITDVILKMHRYSRTTPFPDEWLCKVKSLYNLDGDQGNDTYDFWESIAFEHIRLALDYAYQVTNECMKLSTHEPNLHEKYFPTFCADMDFIKLARECAQINDWDSLYKICNNFSFESLSAVRKCENPELKEQLATCRKLVKEAINNSVLSFMKYSKEDIINDIDYLKPAVEKIVQMVRRLDDEYTKAKKEKNILDFNDLELYAVKLLAQKENGQIYQSKIAKELANGIKEIFVDEYQDTNETQELIFTLLSKDQSNMFMVGDVKQSIYAFRQANPELFINRRNTYNYYDGKTFPAKIMLRNNYRSRPSVTNFVNHVFEGVMTTQSCGIDYNQDELLISSATFMDHPDTDTEIIVVDTADMDENALVLEADMVAQKIRNMVDRGYLVEENSQLRPCRYSDFCILLRSPKNKASVYANMLKYYGVDAWTDDSVSYLSSREIQVMLDLLRVVDNPLNDTSLVAVMMSPMFFFTSDEIAKMRIGSKKDHFYFSVLKDCENSKKTKRFIDIVAHLREKSVVLPVDELIQLIYDQTDFVAVATAMQDGEQRKANLNMLKKYAKEYSDTQSGGLSGFMGYIDRTLENNSEFSSANIASDNANVVRIMSIHRSKGLEFPICIVADCAKAYNMRDLTEPVLMNNKLGITAKIQNKKTLQSYKTLMYDAMARCMSDSIIAEEMRVLYVALTRPKQKLIITMALKNVEKKINALSSSFTKGQISPYVLKNTKSYADLILLSCMRTSDFTKRLENDEGAQTYEMSFKFNIVYGNEDAELVESKQDDDFDFEFTDDDNKAVSILEKQILSQYQNYEQTLLPAKMTVTQISKKDIGSSVDLNTAPSFVSDSQT
ncbi:MAG: helicase-exonuclease AddAB subunit AddA, partial [Oscillospiraceae bacterium]|nr:helicase-exonuclease AddAB subunit AddA [Oscillospiraceae bacterium]